METTANTTNDSDSDQNSAQNHKQNSDQHSDDTTATALLARRRQNLDRDGHIGSERAGYERDGDGHKIGRVTRPKKGEKGTTTVDIDITAIEGAAPSTTSSLRLIELEAEILDDGGAIKNPHIPTNDGVLRSALDHLRPMGLEPAWEVVDHA